MKNKNRILQSEFIKKYYKNKKEERIAINSGIVCVPCDCDYEKCEGWVTCSLSRIHTHIELYIDKENLI